MIYHFTMRGAGEPFLAAAAEFERRYRIPIATVISTRFTRQEPLRRAVRALRRTLPSVPGPTHRLGPHYEIERVNTDEFRSRLRPDDVGISTVFDQIFTLQTIDCFAQLTNLHPSILPFYRGADPMYWVLANGEKTTGITLHEITPKIDAGPIIYQERVDISHVQTRSQLHHLLIRRSVPIFVRYLEHVALGIHLTPRVENAESIYRVHQDYASDPRRPRRRAS